MQFRLPCGSAGRYAAAPTARKKEPCWSSSAVESRSVRLFPFSILCVCVFFLPLLFWIRFVFLTHQEITEFGHMNAAFWLENNRSLFKALTTVHWGKKHPQQSEEHIPLAASEEQDCVCVGVCDASGDHSSFSIWIDTNGTKPAKQMPNFQKPRCVHSDSKEKTHVQLFSRLLLFAGDALLLHGRPRLPQRPAAALDPLWDPRNLPGVPQTPRPGSRTGMRAPQPAAEAGDSLHSGSPWGGCCNCCDLLRCVCACFFLRVLVLWKKPLDIICLRSIDS